MGVLLETLSTGLSVLRGTNSTDSAATPPVSRLGPPTGLGTSAVQATSPAIIPGGQGGIVSQNGLLVVPYGVGADDSTFSLNVYSWRPISLRTGGEQLEAARQQWLAILLCQVACTLSDQQTGIAGGTLGTTSYFCKTLAVTYGNANVSVEVVSTADGRVASFLVDIKGSPLVEIWGDRAGSATSFNALYSMI